MFLNQKFLFERKFIKMNQKISEIKKLRQSITTWKPQFKPEIKISEMDVGHLTNTILFLKRKINELIELKKELNIPVGSISYFEKENKILEWKATIFVMKKELCRKLREKKAE
jgi:hypothetical protein